MSSLSPLEIAGLSLLVVAAVWLALGSPASLSVFKAILSPLEFVWQVSRTADKLSKDMTRSLAARMFWTVVAKMGAGILLSLCFAVVAAVVLAILGRFFPRLRFH